MLQYGPVFYYCSWIFVFCIAYLFCILCMTWLWYSPAVSKYISYVWFMLIKHFMHNFYQPGQCLTAGNILLFHCWIYGATLSTCNIELVDYLIIVMYSYKYTLYIFSIDVFGAQPHFGWHNATTQHNTLQLHYNNIHEVIKIWNLTGIDLKLYMFYNRSRWPLIHYKYNQSFL